MPSRHRVVAGYAAGLVAFLLRAPQPAVAALAVPWFLVGEAIRIWASGHIEKTERLATVARTPTPATRSMSAAPSWPPGSRWPARAVRGRRGRALPGRFLPDGDPGRGGVSAPQVPGRVRGVGTRGAVLRASNHPRGTAREPVSPGSGWPGTASGARRWLFRWSWPCSSRGGCCPSERDGARRFPSGGSGFSPGSRVRPTTGQALLLPPAGSRTAVGMPDRVTH